MTQMPAPTISGHLPVNGLEMYYEIHGPGQPLVLLHGAMSATETSFGALSPGNRAVDADVPGGGNRE